MWGEPQRISAKSCLEAVNHHPDSITGACGGWAIGAEGPICSTEEQGGGERKKVGCVSDRLCRFVPVWGCRGEGHHNDVLCLVFSFSENLGFLFCFFNLGDSLIGAF